MGRLFEDLNNDLKNKLKISLIQLAELLNFLVYIKILSLFTNYINLFAIQLAEFYCFTIVFLLGIKKRKKKQIEDKNIVHNIIVFFSETVFLLYYKKKKKKKKKICLCIAVVVVAVCTAKNGVCKLYLLKRIAHENKKNL